MARPLITWFFAVPGSSLILHFCADHMLQKNMALAVSGLTFISLHFWPLWLADSFRTKLRVPPPRRLPWPPLGSSFFFQCGPRATWAVLTYFLLWWVSSRQWQWLARPKSLAWCLLCGINSGDIWGLNEGMSLLGCWVLDAHHHFVLMSPLVTLRGQCPTSSGCDLNDPAPEEGVPCPWGIQGSPQSVVYLESWM